MKDVSGKELCKILKKHGWELKTIKGSHLIPIPSTVIPTKTGIYYYLFPIS